MAQQMAGDAGMEIVLTTPEGFINRAIYTLDFVPPIMRPSTK